MLTLANMLITVLVGAFVGWLAGLVLSGRGYGFVANATAGVMGAFLVRVMQAGLGFAFGGDWVAFTLGGLIGLPIAAIVLLGFTINATIGAILVIFLLRGLRHV